MSDSGIHFGCHSVSERSLEGKHNFLDSTHQGVAVEHHITHRKVHIVNFITSAK